MINSDKNIALSLIKSTSEKLLPDCQILLFGSRARNDNVKYSDYDFLIITKENIETSKKRNYKSQIRKILAQQKIPADILIQSESEVEIKKNIIGHIIRQAVKEGIII